MCVSSSVIATIGRTDGPSYFTSLAKYVHARKREDDIRNVHKTTKLPMFSFLRIRKSSAYHDEVVFASSSNANYLIWLPLITTNFHTHTITNLSLLDSLLLFRARETDRHFLLLSPPPCALVRPSVRSSTSERASVSASERRRRRLWRRLRRRRASFASFFSTLERGGAHQRRASGWRRKKRKGERALLCSE